MTKTNKITLSYGLIYLTLGLIVNQHFILSVFSFSISIAFLVELLNNNKKLSFIPVVISIIINVLTISVGLTTLASLDEMSLLFACLLVIYSALFLLANQTLSTSKQAKVFKLTLIMYLSLTSLMLISQIIIHKLTGFGMISGFWYFNILLGSTCLSTFIYQSLKVALTKVVCYKNI